MMTSACVGPIGPISGAIGISSGLERANFTLWSKSERLPGICVPGASGMANCRVCAAQRGLILADDDCADADDDVRGRDVRPARPLAGEDDPGDAPVAVPGFLRLILEVIVLGSGVWALYASSQTTPALIFAAQLLFHYAISYDRIIWLLRQK